ncbi:peptidylprolyl isomerase [Shewanella sp. 10N.286.52.B9]|uniref:peptidylprolyl isomerase n=1 Tax=Shewanella sp. 10N.286.52.B9 TaxID=1880837 RepID=UPI000C84085F|nr:peptidylprolyl isomerase [Shewanella sp. 10N.286.52.B9]PMG39256.1 peptidylprolyl isomerase [Shewanella sp. 10N.286.52.B9]
MKVVKFLVAMTTVSVLISGCSDKENTIATVDGDVVTSTQLHAYLQYKRIDLKNEKQVLSAKTHYLRHLALVKAIENQETLDQAAINAELFELKKDLMLNRYLQNYLTSAVNDVAIRNYYAENQDKYQETKAKVSHILLRVAPNANEQDRQVIYSKAMEAYSKLRSGEPFADIANTYSEDKISAKKAGSLGWVLKGAISPVFSNQVFEELEKDQISEPFLTEFGYHIVLLEQAPSVVKQPFEKVRGDIKRILRKMAKDAELDRLKSSIEITQ